MARKLSTLFALISSVVSGQILFTPEFTSAAASGPSTTVTQVSVGSGCNFCSSYAFPVAAGIPVGHRVILVSESSADQAGQTATDNASTPNTYTCIGPGGMYNIYVCSAYIAFAIPAITGTVTLNINGGASNGAGMFLYDVSTGQSGSYDVKGPGTTGTSASQSDTLSGAQTAADVVVLACGIGTTATTGTPGSGYTLVTNAGTTTGYPIPRNIYLEYKLSASGTPSATMTTDMADDWSCQVAAYKQ